MTHDADTIATHGLTTEEYDRIEERLGRAPNLLELGIFSVMWSEHCSYKSSRRHLSTFPTAGPAVVHGPGENAGVVDIGDGHVVVFKMESHNHPSFIEPYQGAATGVGGIMRDVFTMGARPVAIMNALRFGALDHPKTKHLLSGVVAGIGGYGNCMGVPTIGGETNFDPRYNDNILVNAMCVGVADADKIFLSAAEGAGNPVVYVGSKTGRDGIHGATMASAEFDEASEEKRPTVQVGDPFMEKLLLEACLELMATGAVIAIQDMGAAGLTSSSVEMAAKGAKAGQGGFDLDLDHVPQREDNMSSYEMMLSESQERMLVVLSPGKEEQARAIFHKWGVDFAVIGRTTDTGRLVIRHREEVVADLPLEPLADEAPNYDRPYEASAAPAPLADPKVVLSEIRVSLSSGTGSLEEIAEALIAETVSGKTEVEAIGASLNGGTATLYACARDHSAAPLEALAAAAANLEQTGVVGSAVVDHHTQTVSLADSAGGATLLTALGKLMATPDLCSREWIWSQYDHSVMGDTVIAPGSDAGVVRVHGTDKALAITTDVTPRYCLAQPSEGGKQAVAEAYRNLCATGARPLAITNCLNFASPENAAVMAQFVGCIGGIAEAAKALDMPVVSGNVSLYNETNGRGIPPTPAIGAVGLLPNAAGVIRMTSGQEGDAIVALGITRGWLGQSVYLRDLFEVVEGAPPPVDLHAERTAGELLRRLVTEAPITAAHDVSDGGILVAVAELCLSSGVGAALSTPVKDRRAAYWFGEDQGRYIFTLPAPEADRVVLKCAMAGVQATRLGVLGGEEIILDGRDRLSLFDLDALHRQTLPTLFTSAETDPMPMAKDDLETMIKDALPDADIELTALAGDDDHWKARIVSAAFDGLNRVQQHQLVYRALKGRMGGELHALALETVAKQA